jgi:hypothetical protein
MKAASARGLLMTRSRLVGGARLLASHAEIHDENVVHAYNSLRQHADSLRRGEDVMDKMRAAVDRLLEFIRVALAKGRTTPI